MILRVCSFDFDGCLFNKNYINSQEKDVIKSNQNFLNIIKQENKLFTKVYTLIGSNRQSLKIDLAALAHKGSCFPAIKKVSDFLGATLDTFLLADIFGNLKAGASYAYAIDKNYKGAHSDWLFDETKATVIYAQMHKIANDNPNEKIIFDFYDDRGNGLREQTDILEKLRDFYSKNLDLIPANLILRLYQYAGTAVTLIAQLRGTGFIDENYRQTVKDLAQQALKYSNDKYKNYPLYVADCAQPEKLQNRKALLTKLGMDNSVGQVESRTINKKDIINSFSSSLNNKYVQKEQKDYSRGIGLYTSSSSHSFEKNSCLEILNNFSQQMQQPSWKRFFNQLSQPSSNSSFYVDDNNEDMEKLEKKTKFNP